MNPTHSVSNVMNVDWRIFLSAIALSLLAAIDAFAFETNPSPNLGTSHAVKLRNPTAKFAQSEISRYEEIISAATERAENETNPQQVERLAQQLKKLTHEMDLAKKAESQWQKAVETDSEPFARENLKESIELLQDSGGRLLEELIAADRESGTTSARKTNSRSSSDLHLSQE